MYRGRTLRVVVMSSALIVSAYAARAETIYVKWNASGANDGTSWTHAYTDLQDALARARSPGECTQESPCEIWVAKGSYKPTPWSSKEDSFELINHVGIYGGFAGDETIRTQCVGGSNPGDPCSDGNDCLDGGSCADLRDFGYCLGGSNQGNPCSFHIPK